MVLVGVSMCPGDLTIASILASISQVYHKYITRPPNVTNTNFKMKYKYLYIKY